MKVNGISMPRPAFRYLNSRQSVLDSRDVLVKFLEATNKLILGARQSAQDFIVIFRSDSKLGPLLWQRDREGGWRGGWTAADGRQQEAHPWQTLQQRQSRRTTGTSGQNHTSSLDQIRLTGISTVLESISLWPHRCRN